MTGLHSTELSLTMANLSRNPQIIRLAGTLGLSSRGDCATEITRYALDKVERAVAESPFTVTSLEALREVLADRLSVCIRYLDFDSDLSAIVEEFGQAIPHLAGQLRADFVHGRSEGLLLALQRKEEWQRRYLAIIDRRADEANRAYFTAWHEIAHLLTLPAQLAFAGMRRSPTREEIKKDAIEQLTDQIAGLVAFYEPLFKPVFQMETGGAPLTFPIIERVRLNTAPEASFHSAALACVRLCRHPTLFVKLERRYRAREQRRQSAGQLPLPISAETATQPQLRIAQCYANAAAQRSALEIFRQMRVPPQSLLTRVFESGYDSDATGNEDQSWWETSKDGPLTALPLTVHGYRRGAHVYGMLCPRKVH